jgi:aminoglycoside 6-adenylyltransferase
MNNERKIFDILLEFVKKDDCIRAVAMEGSKNNKNAPIDIFQDYDITFFVNDMGKFKINEEWLNIFGKMVIMQKPDEMSLFPPADWIGKCQKLTYLMIFEDGNKIDLKIMLISEMKLYFKLFADSLCKIILDKDNLFPLINEPSDIDFHVKKPSEEFVDNCSNEFWWVSTYVTKGICRNELLYVIEHLNIMRKQLLLMVSWKVGIETSFSISVGKSYKYLDKYVSKETWEAILRTYNCNTIDSAWDSLILCCNLFQEMENYVSKELCYKCPEYNKNVIKYIEQYFPENKKGKIKIV